MDQSIILLLATIFILQQFTRWELLTDVLGVLVFVAIAILLPRLKGITLYLTSAFVVGGVALMLVQKADADMWFGAAGMNATIVTLFAFAPLFGIPVRLPKYVAALQRFYETKVQSGVALFAGTQLLTQIMGAFINVGSISVVYHLAFVKPREAGMSKLLANALNRGFAGAILWSPYFAAMALITSALGVRWSELLPYLVVLTLLSFLVSMAIDFRKLLHPEGKVENRQSEDSTTPIEGVDGRSGFPIGLAVYLISAIAVILIMESFIDLPMVLITCMTAVTVPLIWCLFQGQSAIYREGIVNHIQVTLPSLKKEITLFLAAGFFSGSIGATGIGDYLPALLEPIPLPIWLSFSFMVVILMIISSLIGLHPIVLVTIFATGIDPAAVHMSANDYAILLLGGWALSNPISPASAVNNLLAGLFKKTVFELASPNYKYAACMAVLLLLFMLAIRL
ncbi:hypothetical protein [Paenibacillus harenae]|uniref:hypothetical protein n=1 Tax=Paenibacillus harenae TaxID=306543 RepID=UPI0027D8E5A9|nr:hypothetical protein [Paenibacillus harenae]